MEINDPIESALLWLNNGHNVAIATVVKTWGSAPRKAGAGSIPETRPSPCRLGTVSVSVMTVSVGPSEGAEGLKM